MGARVLMVQGTASSVGKTVLVAALCRIFRQDGWKVAPFIAQNMALNSFVTPDGAEIGRAQAMQAEAAGIPPSVEMNPILLKPEGDNRCQLVLRGKPVGGFPAGDADRLRDELWAAVTESLDALLQRFDLVVCEGAGSPAEINLKERDLVNMRVARYCRAPVLLVGDIDRGGVFASLVGTLDLLDPDERRLVRALVINKFRGDISLLEPGLEWLERRTGLPVAGVVPFFRNIALAEEDSLSLETRRALHRARGALSIAVIGLPHISNFDDFDPLARRPGVRLYFVEPGIPLEDPDLIILPGTKNTAEDLKYLRSSGLADQIGGRAAAGCAIIGICGGFQMLGRTVSDPQGIESGCAGLAGLGLLPVATEFQPVKTTHQVEATVANPRGILSGMEGISLRTYEIHMGRTHVDPETAVFRIDRRSGRSCGAFDGVLNAEANVFGTYFHGLFHNEAFTEALLRELARRRQIELPPVRPYSQEAEYDKLADHVRSSLDMQLIYTLSGLNG